MDFCQLLHKAQKNDKSSSTGSRFYSTKFEPPKKIKKESKDLSANIKKFLAKRDEEEQKKREEEQRKKEDLLALRAQDKKATRRVNVMLKRTKSANQSVIQDAVDNTHTAVTRAGPEQPDEDDYGYVSQEASALYEKMMEKYSQMPEEPKFNLLKKKVSTNLSSTKDRVKAALEREREESMQPHRRKRKKKDGENGDDKDDEDEKSPERKENTKDVAKPKSKPRPAAPPPMSFTELLKIAAQKQHEPIVIEEKPQEEEKLYTKKQRRELEKEREFKERREQRHREMENRDKHKEKDREKKDLKPILKASSSESKILERQLTKPQSQNKDREKDKAKQVKFGNSMQKSSESLKKPIESKPSSSATKNGDLKQAKLGSGGNNKPALPNGNKSGKNSVPSKSDSSVAKKDGDVRKGGASGKFSGKPKEFPPRDLLPKGKPKEFPPRDLKPKQFPPPDLRGIKRKQPIVASRGRIMDDDDSEYDSELDDFIDDGPEEGDYSSYIKEIFGYDKSRYRDVDEDDDNMESSFAQQMKEECRSAKIGIMEDLEDMRKEEEDKRRKALMKKKMRR